ncbi:YbhB/YbcL family Raf kinase inhibitor-like protein [Erythrobacter sp.]|jgi:phosphatidylethanolamine-binding protein (PEBP) family uncharacterized protein|uniref:YbhB/YbcL family Raf kinase inhibitor-like protein n=1 Tax=Erythrobacter sp. TaxID=1042 RepID=UPI002E9CFF98|nr:YbhB/YbcL family Raf kinase inhibitor-like protein [Erythrobacter sp.]
MPELPSWLTGALPESARHPGLAIARLGDAKSFERGGLKLSSPAFAAGGQLDPCFTATEEDAVAPPLEWTAPPPGSQELIVIVEDATGGAGAAGEPACHWLVWGLAGQRGKLLEGEAPPRTGKNAHGNSEWLLPDPPIGETRDYVFQLFATDLPLTLMPGASREELIHAIEGSVTGCSVLHAQFTGVEAADASMIDDPIDGDMT